MQTLPHAMQPGLAEPVFDSQAIFRGVLEVLSQPGSVHTLSGLPPAELPPYAPATLALCLALADYETPVWLQPGPEGNRAMADYLRFHCGCPVVDQPRAARFALIHDAQAMPALESFDAGSNEYPDRSATLIVQVRHLAEGESIRLHGPGIRDSRQLAAEGLPPGFWTHWQLNAAQFPRGVDVILAAGRRIAGLPRTTQSSIPITELPCM